MNNPPNLRDKVRSLQLPADNKQTSRTFPFTLLVVCLMLVVAAVGYGRGWFSSISSPATSTTSPSIKEAAATPTTPSEREATRSSPQTQTNEKVTTPKPAEPRTSLSREGIVLESNGYFMPARKILVSPKVSGMLMAFNLQEGQRVQKGQVLGVIESVEYESDLNRFQAALDSAQQRLLELENGNRKEEIEQASAELAETEAMLKKSESDYNRARDLLQKNSFTQAEFDDVFANYQSQKRRVERLKAALKLMELGPRVERKAQAKADVALATAEIAKAQWRLENCKIRSPISGTILTKNAEEGNIVNPVAMNGSFSLCEMADLSDLEVDLKIQERDVARIFAGQTCKVRAIAYPDRIYEGVVDRLMPIADRSKGAVPIRVKVKVPAAEEGVYLKPDMGAIVTFYAK
jgi:multidrug resistance efflux pump